MGRPELDPMRWDISISTSSRKTTRADSPYDPNSYTAAEAYIWNTNSGLEREGEESQEEAIKREGGNSFTEPRHRPGNRPAYIGRCGIVESSRATVAATV